MENLGNVAWQDQRNPIFSEGGYDLDTAHVPYSGAETGKAAFTQALTTFTALAGYPKMFLMRWTDDDEPHFPTVTLEYRGCKSGTAPPVQVEDGLSLQNASVSVESTSYYTGTRTDGNGTTTTVTVQMDIEFYAYQTTYSWYALTQPPASPAYSVARRTADLSGNIISRQYRITATDNEVDAPVGGIASVNVGTYTQLNNALIAGHKLQEYKVIDLVPNKLWQCSSSVNYTYTPTGV